ncbi:hypothetical protein ACP4OV_012798 [Aristida adscensionis]
MAASRAPAPAPASAAVHGRIEENAMALLDSSGIRDSRDLHDDQAAFLEDVRSACLAGHKQAPSWILRNSSSLELAVASFNVLMELGKQYPRTYLTGSGAHQSLVVVKESWLPFLLGKDAVCIDTGGSVGSSDHLFDPSVNILFCFALSKRLSLLIEDMVENSNGMDGNNGIKAIVNMMLFQYLVNTLEADFVPRHTAYKDAESLEWVIFRESLLNMLLGSRKIVFKSLVKNCMYILLNHEAEDAVEDSLPSEENPAKLESDKASSLNFSSFESKKTLQSVQKLFVMVMNLDLIRKEADRLGLTSRADGFRSYKNPIMEVILDELTYNISYLSPFLLAFKEWNWKLDIILQYFSTYCGKAAVRSRRSDNSQQKLNLNSVLSFFLTTTSTKAIVKKMSSDVAQLLLAHAYQVCLSVQGDSSDTTATAEQIGATLQQITCNLITAFQNIREINPNIQISPFEKKALFTAAMLTRKLKNEES